MKRVIELFEQIKNTSSLNEKKEIIKKNDDNMLFRRCLAYLLNDEFPTGISLLKIKKSIKVKYSGELNTFDDVMEYLKYNDTGSDKDIYLVQRFIKKQDQEDRDFYIKMVTKKYKLGCDKKIVNSVIPALIPEFNVMLGTPIEKCTLKAGETYYLSRKLNGSRCVHVLGKLMTRQGKEYKGLEHILKDIDDIDYSGMMLDGELLYKNEEGLSDSEAFQKGVGIAMSNSDDKSMLKYVIFDILPMMEFYEGISQEKYSKRTERLDKLKETIEKYQCKNIEVVERVYSGTDSAKIWEWLDYAEKNDWEGIMVNLDTPYECKRTRNLMKVKQFYDVSLRIVDVSEGTGHYEGKLGAFVCKYYNNTVSVGSGFTDKQRKEYWKNKEDFIGKIIDIKYKEETVDKDTGLKSLQFPVFICFRDPSDKPLPDDEV